MIFVTFFKIFVLVCILHDSFSFYLSGKFTYCETTNICESFEHDILLEQYDLQICPSNPIANFINKSGRLVSGYLANNGIIHNYTDYEICITAVYMKSIDLGDGILEFNRSKRLMQFKLLKNETVIVFNKLKHSKENSEKII